MEPNNIAFDEVIELLGLDTLLDRSTQISPGANGSVSRSAAPCSRNQSFF